MRKGVLARACRNPQADISAAAVAQLCRQIEAEIGDAVSVRADRVRDCGRRLRVLIIIQ